MRRGIYAHPADLIVLGRRGGLAALRDLGFTDVAMATLYHAGRFTVPLGPPPLVRFLEDGVVHFRPRARYGELQPHPSREVAAGGSPLAEFLDEAARAGVRAHAWTVLFHNTRLGEAHADSCVRNAFGDRYVYALCPSRAEVREFGCRLAADIAAHGGLEAVELEVAGFMGYKHGSHHDKTSFPGDDYGDFLLSYCFCEACLGGLAALGADAARIQQRVRELLERRFVDADLLAFTPVASASARERLQADLGADLLEAMLAHRTAACRRVLSDVRTAVGGSVRITVHLQPDPFFTGSQMGQPARSVETLVDGVIVTHYGEGPEHIERAWQGRELGSLPAQLAFWPKPVEFRDDAAVQRVARVAREHGCEGVRVYMLGLLPWPTVQRVARLLAS